MKKIARRLGCLLLFLVWAIIMAFPIFAFNLSRNGQMQFGNTRIFLVTEVESGGVGFQSTTGIGFQSTSEARNEPSCNITNIRYFLWDGDPEPAKTCSCNDGVERVPDGSSCVEP